MSSQPECPDGSLAKLEELGLRFAIIDNNIVIATPYLDERGALRRGFLCDPLNYQDEKTIGLPRDHQMYFAGDAPHQTNGEPLLNTVIGSTDSTFPIMYKLNASFYFSYKIMQNGQKREYTSLYEKVRQYYIAISGPAMEKYKECEYMVTDFDFSNNRDSPFIYPDAHSSAAGIENLNDPFRDLTVGIVGVGGTGAYILDFLSKTPIKKIKIFDDDEFVVKNAFRSPGTSIHTEFKKFKVEVYKNRYSSFRTGIEAYPCKISEDNSELLDECDFVFIAVDKGSARRSIAAILDKKGKQYIDSGLGLERTEHGLVGMVRSTLVQDGTRDRVIGENILPEINADQEEYLSNIQISEINALNASMSVMRFKEIFGFYGHYESWYNCVLVTARSNLIRQGA